MKTTQMGICKLCGRETKLTFEHVPPQSAFNKSTVSIIEQEEALKLLTEEGRMPWDTSGLKKRIKQGGVGDYFLCDMCNNNTGSWYMSDYVRFIETINNLLVNFDIQHAPNLHFVVYQYPALSIFKAIMTMFCDINNNCFGDNELRNYLLNKEATEFNSKRYRVFAYIWKEGFPRRNSLSAQVNSDGSVLYLTEISGYPVGFILYIDLTTSVQPSDMEITFLSKYKYGEKVDSEFNMRIHGCYTTFPGDFRSQKEITNMKSDE